MRKIIHLFLYLLLVAVPFSLIAQHKVDSLRKVLKTEKEDTSKVKTLNNLAQSLYNSEPDSTISLAEQANALAAKLGWTNGEADACGYLGIAYAIKGDYPKALDYYMQALKMDEEVGDKRGQASNFGNIGLAYYYQAEYSKALEYYLKALKIAEQIGNKKWQANNLCNIGSVYIDQGDYPKALNYDMQALKIAEQIGNKKLLLNTLGNIGIVYMDQKEYDTAVAYYMKTLKMAEELGDKRGQADSYSNIGIVYMSQKDYNNAIACYIQALKIYEEMGDNDGQASNLNNLGTVYTKTGKFKEAEEYLKKAIILDSSIGDRDNLMQSEENISQLYDTTGRYKQALIWYKKGMILKNTLFNIDKDKALTRKEMTYEFDKKEAAEKAEQDKKDVIAESDKKRQVIITASVSIVLLLALVFSGLLFSRFKVTKQQKKLIEERNKDITDSINYAKTIQRVLLKEEEHVSKHLPEHFILFKPKDIVSGDFYWAIEKEEYFYFAAVDCTGHGVPGGFMSMLGLAFLNEITKGSAILTPAEILEELRNKILKELKQTGAKDESKDGMDISLMRMNLKTREVQWSGANNPLYIINNELKEIAPDKQPIGYYPLMKPFSNHIIKTEKDSVLYLFTDGYADQFGGAKGKKLKHSGLKGLLLSIHKKDLKEQKKILHETFESWKGNLEQVDDILLIGVKV